MPILKNVFEKRHYTLLALPIALSIIPLNAQAGCNREDIDHYLAKGFTTSQITSICGAATNPVPKKVPEPPVEKKETIVKQDPVIQKIPEPNKSAPQPVTKATTHYVPPVQQQEPKSNFLIDVINGYDTVLTSDSLSYTIKQCYEVGEEDLFGFPPEICPEIRYTLNLDGMKIVDTGRKYFFFGPPEIVLNGQVNREIITDLKDIKPKQKELLFKQVYTGDEVVLPIQQGTPMQRVQTELRKVFQ